MHLSAMQVVAKHDAPVRHCFFVKQLGAGMLVTGGWDKTVGPASEVPGPCCPAAAPPKHSIDKKRAPAWHNLTF
jgi:hypothetical protein